MKISQTPDAPRGRIGWRRPSHWLKSPMTLTRSALGAHTAKAHALRALVLDQVRAQLFIQPQVGALVEEVQIEIGENGRIAVRIFDFVASRSGARPCRAG